MNFYIIFFVNLNLPEKCVAQRAAHCNFNSNGKYFPPTEISLERKNKKGISETLGECLRGASRPPSTRPPRRSGPLLGHVVVVVVVAGRFSIRYPMTVQVAPGKTRNFQNDNIYAKTAKSVYVAGSAEKFRVGFSFIIKFQ